MGHGALPAGGGLGTQRGPTGAGGGGRDALVFWVQPRKEKWARAQKGRLEGRETSFLLLLRGDPALAL